MVCSPDWTISDLLYRANYCVLATTLIKKMPKEWQWSHNRLVDKLYEAFPSVKEINFKAYTIDPSSEKNVHIKGKFRQFLIIPVCLMLSMPEWWQDQMAMLLQSYDDTWSEVLEGCNTFQIESDRHHPFDYRHKRFNPVTEEQITSLP